MEQQESCQEAQKQGALRHLPEKDTEISTWTSVSYMFCNGFPGQLFVITGHIGYSKHLS